VKKLEKCKSSRNSDDIVHSSLFDSEKKRRSISKLLEFINSKEIIIPNACMEEYREEILRVRNILAHVKEELDGNGEIYLRSLIKGFEALKFDDQFCITIRNDIRKHSKNLDKIIDVIDTRIVEASSVG